jgi:hypothetical protein
MQARWTACGARLLFDGAEFTGQIAIPNIGSSAGPGVASLVEERQLEPSAELPVSGQKSQRG